MQKTPCYYSKAESSLCSHFLFAYRFSWHPIPDENLWLVGCNSQSSLPVTYMHPDIFQFLHTGRFSGWRRCNSISRLWTQGATKQRFMCFHWRKVNPSFVDSFAAQTQSVTAANGLIWWVLSLSESKPNMAGTNDFTEVVFPVTTETCSGGFCHYQRPLMELQPLSSFLFWFIMWISSVPSSLCLIWGSQSQRWVSHRIWSIAFLQFY